LECAFDVGKILMSQVLWNLSGKIWIQYVVQKIDTYIAKQCSHVEFPYFVMGSTLGPTAQATLV
jgi:hypothetical protein